MDERPIMCLPRLKTTDWPILQIHTARIKLRFAFVGHVGTSQQTSAQLHRSHGVSRTCFHPHIFVQIWREFQLILQYIDTGTQRLKHHKTLLECGQRLCNKSKSQERLLGHKLGCCSFLHYRPICCRQPWQKVLRSGIRPFLSLVFMPSRLSKQKTIS